MCTQGFKQQAKTLNHEKKIHQGVDPFQCQVMKAGPFFFWLKCCRHVCKVFPTLTSWPFTEFGSTVTKNLSSAAFVDKVLCGSKYWTSMWRCTLVKDRSGELSNVWLLYLIKLWQVWPVWWGFHPRWRSQETRPETQDQRGHPYRGGKATAWTGKKTLWVLW